MLQVMCSVQGVQMLEFDLTWDYPALNAQDYLDGTCMVCAGPNILEYVDFRTNTTTDKSGFVPDQATEENPNRQAALQHSGDVHRPNGTGCSHKIVVYTSQLHDYVDNLFFVLSAWNAATIGAYPRPQVNVYQVLQNGEKELRGTYEIARAKAHEAVVMCCLHRSAIGGWEVVLVEAYSAGNAKNYNHIKQTITGMIPTFMAL